MSRVDDQGDSSSTLGEYRDLWAALGGEDNKAVAFIDLKIAEQGRNEEVIAADSQMMLLFAKLMFPDTEARL